ncbi:MAG: hypothetical protein ACSLFI_11910 [Solirubrobacterales bacterium]
MKSFGKLASLVSIVSLVVLAAVTGASPAQANDSSGNKIYKHRSDDMRLRLAVKGHRVTVESLKYRRTCEGSGSKNGWTSEFTNESARIKKDGLFGIKDYDDFGQTINVQLNARIKKGTIRGYFRDTYFYADPSDGESTHCWTGEGYFKPKLKFKAHLVR